MEKFIYFASDGEIFPDGPRLALGFGFTPDGRWRDRAVPRSEVLAVDDRFLPNDAGLQKADSFLRDWKGWILWDLEKPPQPAFERLVRQIGPSRSVVPPAWAGVPHSAVLIGPYLPCRSFTGWLKEQKSRFGKVVLDGAPIRHCCFPGCALGRWTGPLPDEGRLCAGSGCLCAKDGSAFVYWDNRETLLRRCTAASVPAIILAAEWDALAVLP